MVGRRQSTPDAFRLQCRRCETKLRVPRAKAGKRGRCPVCGGPIKVPTEKEYAPHARAPLPVSHHEVVILSIVGGVLLLLAVASFLVLRGGGASDTPQTTDEQAAAESRRRIRRISAELATIGELTRSLSKYADLRQHERRLHARDILGRMRAYEPLKPEEYALRRRVLEERREAVQATAEPGEAEAESPAATPLPSFEDINRPLNTLEQTELRRLSGEVGREATRLARLFETRNVKVDLVPDLMGRSVLDERTAAAVLQARAETLLDAREDARAKME